MKSFLILVILFYLVSCASKFKGKEVELENLDQVAPVTKTTAQVAVNPAPTIEKQIKTFTNPKLTKPEIKPEAPPLKPQATIEGIPVPWSVGERLTYQAHAIGLDAAQFTIEVSPKKDLRGEQAWHFSVHGETTGFTKKIYYINFKAESFINDQLLPLQYQTGAFEGDDQKQNLEQYLVSAKKYYVYKKRNSTIEKNENKDFSFPDKFSDPVSFFYYLRVVKANESFTLLSNHKSKKITVTALKKVVLEQNGSVFDAEELTLSYEGKSHTVWRESRGARRILRANISLSFANGLITLKNP